MQTSRCGLRAVIYSSPVRAVKPILRHEKKRFFMSLVPILKEMKYILLGNHKNFKTVFRVTLFLTLLTGAKIFLPNMVYAQAAKEPPKTLYQRVEMVLKYGHSQQVRDAVGRVNELKEEEQMQLLPVLKDLLKIDDYLVQKKVLDFIANSKWKDLDSEAIPFLDSSYDAVFYAAVNAIEKKEVQQAQPLVEEKLKKGDYTKEDNKLLTLIRLSSSLQNPSLVDFFDTQMREKQNHIVMRREMFRYMGDVQTHRADIISYLTENALDEKESITLRAHAVYALSKTSMLDSAAHFKTILRQIDNLKDEREKRKYAALRSQLITALAASGDKDVLDVLILMSKNDDPAVRIRAVRELGKLNKKEALELIRYKSVYDSDLNVQAEARKALQVLEKGSEKYSNLENLEE